MLVTSMKSPPEWYLALFLLFSQHKALQRMVRSSSLHRKTRKRYSQRHTGNLPVWCDRFNERLPSVKFVVSKCSHVIPHRVGQITAMVGAPSWRFESRLLCISSPASTKRTLSAPTAALTSLITLATRAIPGLLVHLPEFC